MGVSSVANFAGNKELRMLNAQVQVQTILYPKVSGVKRPVGCQGSSTILSLVAITFHLRHRLKGIFSVACACENFGRSSDGSDLGTDHWCGDNVPL